MKSYLTAMSVALVAGSFVFAGCQDIEAAPVPIEFGTSAADVNIIEISANEMRSIAADGTLVVRTSNADDVLLFDASLEPADFERLEIVCPNGRQMGMVEWLAELGNEQNIDIEALTGSTFAVSRNQEYARYAITGGMSPTPGASQPLLVPPGDGECCGWYDGVWTCSYTMCPCTTVCP